MKRLALPALVLAGFVALACRTAAPPPPPPPPPPPCLVVTDPVYVISVDRDARPGRDCVEFSQSQTEIVWEAPAADVTLLGIAFKRGGPDPRPGDPTCSGPRCSLPKGTHVTARRVVHYNVVVLRRDGTPKAVDPRLIIVP